MDISNFFKASILLSFFLSCGGGNTTATALFEIQLDGNKAEFQQNENIGIHLQNKKNKTIEKVTYTIDGKILPVDKEQITLDIPHLGNKILKAVVDYDGGSVEISKKLKILSSKAPEIYTYEIINEYPHDAKAYTQGLEFYQDTLYESTGKNGRSSLRKVDYSTGKVLEKIDLDKTVFGEGLTIFNGKIYQLTWQNGLGYIYDLNNFKKLGDFQYGESKEGWGLAHDAEKIIKSDGTEKIWFLNPQTLLEEGYIETVTNKSIFNKTNELEYLDGKLYANVYQKPSIMIIDASSGAIEGVINLSGLDAKVSKTSTWSDTDNVLNGIAYNQARKTFFITGKDWDTLFEVRFLKK